MATCDDCGKQFYPGEGLWDDGDYMCGECLANQIEKARNREEKSNKQQLQYPVTDKK